ncbi:hypothetical protein MTO96_005334 [Rhipicephalus appendiculatus]
MTASHRLATHKNPLVIGSLLDRPPQLAPPRLPDHPGWRKAEWKTCEGAASQKASTKTLNTACESRALVLSSKSTLLLVLCAACARAYAA